MRMGEPGYSGMSSPRKSIAIATMRTATSFAIATAIGSTSLGLLILALMPPLAGCLVLLGKPIRQKPRRVR
jgi:hypothetical protein